MRCTRPLTFLPIVVLLCFQYAASAQFAPAADLSGTTAIPAGSNSFVDWASGCVVQRGPMNIANPSLGLATAGADSAGTGPSDAVTVSLGDGGNANLTFNHSIYNGPGADFAVFENGFMVNDSNIAFLELGFVEVSTDGVHYIRFPATTYVQDTAQLNNDGGMDCAQINNLAGKYVAHYGTPFDLNELVDSPGLDVNNVNYIKIIDVVGSVDSAYGSRDHNGRMINDPWPTPFASCGFDLDAIGVIHATGISGITSTANVTFKVYPNPVYTGDVVLVQLPENALSLKLTDINGRLLHQWEMTVNNNTQTIFTGNLSPGVYFLTTETPSARFNAKLITQ
jgi:Secretion system C-terminal sorting domain